MDQLIEKLRSFTDRIRDPIVRSQILEEIEGDQEFLRGLGPFVAPKWVELRAVQEVRKSEGCHDSQFRILALIGRFGSTIALNLSRVFLSDCEECWRSDAEIFASQMRASCTLESRAGETVICLTQLEVIETIEIDNQIPDPDSAEGQQVIENLLGKLDLDDGTDTSA